LLGKIAGEKMTAAQPDRLDRIEAEIERMLSVQRELQESQIRQEDRMNRLFDTTERNTEAISTLERSTAQLERSTAQLERSTAQLERSISQLERSTSQLERSVTQLVTVATAHQDSLEQLKRTVDYLISKDRDLS
jgi:DNA repair exonuclease SbcCD ATPase subunit